MDPSSLLDPGRLQDRTEQPSAQWHKISSSEAILDDDRSFRPQSPLSPLTDIHTISKAMPVSYWCGRYNVLSDRARSADPMESEANRLERVLFEMELWCASPEALDSLKAFKVGLHKNLQQEAKKVMEKRNREKKPINPVPKIAKPPSGKENVPPFPSKNNNKPKAKEAACIKPYQNSGVVQGNSSPPKKRMPLSSLPVTQESPARLATPRPKYLPISKSLTNLADSLGTCTPKTRAEHRISKASSNPCEKTRTLNIFPKLDARAQGLISVSTVDLSKMREFDKLEKMGLPPMLRLREAIATYGPNKITPIRNVNSPGYCKNRRSIATFNEQRFDPSQNQKTLPAAPSPGPSKMVRVSMDDGESSKSRRTSSVRASSANKQQSPPRGEDFPGSLPSPAERKVSGRSSSTVPNSEALEPNHDSTPSSKKGFKVQPRQTRTSLLRANKSRQNAIDSKNTPGSAATPKTSGKSHGPSGPNVSPSKSSRLPITRKSLLIDNSQRATTQTEPRSKTLTAKIARVAPNNATNCIIKPAGGHLAVSRESLEDIGSYLNGKDDDEFQPQRKTGIRPKNVSSTLLKPAPQSFPRNAAKPSNMALENESKIADYVNNIRSSKLNIILPDFGGQSTQEGESIDKPNIYIANITETSNGSNIVHRIIPSAEEFERLSESEFAAQTKKRDRLAAMGTNRLSHSHCVLQDISFNRVQDVQDSRSIRPQDRTRKARVSTALEKSNFNLQGPASRENSVVESADVSNISTSLDDSSWSYGSEQSPPALHLQIMDKFRPDATSTPPTATVSHRSRVPFQVYEDACSLQADKNNGEDNHMEPSYMCPLQRHRENSSSPKRNVAPRPSRSGHISRRTFGDKPPLRAPRAASPVFPSPEALNASRIAMGVPSRVNENIPPARGSPGSKSSGQSSKGSPSSIRFISNARKHSTSLEKIANPANRDLMPPANTSSYRPLNLPRLVQNQRVLRTVLNELPDPLPVNPIGVAMDFLTAARECGDGPVKEEYFSAGTTLIENISKSVSLEKKFEELKLELAQVEFEMLTQKHRTFKMALAVKTWQDGGRLGSPPDLKSMQ